MLEYYISDTDSKLQKIDELKKGCWVNMVAPSEAEIKLISDRLEIPEDFIKDPLDDEERSRLEREDNHVLIIVDFPYITYDDAGNPFYETLPIGLIVTDECFITISLIENPVITDFISKKIKGFFTYKKTRFALQILFNISSYYLRYLKQINRKTDNIEKELHQSMKNEELYAFLSLEKSLVYFTTSLKSNKIVLQKLLRLNHLKMYEEDKDLLEDVIIENTQAIEMAETYHSILTSMMNTFASVISNNLNIVMKFLTSITIILSFPTIVASIYGMNVNLPFQNNPYAFIGVICVALLLSSITTIIFWKKRYF